MKKKKILIAGGDMRQIFCAAKLSEEYDIYLTGFDSEYIPGQPELKQADENMREEFDYSVLPVVPTDSSGNISVPCSSEVLRPEAVKKMLRPGAVVFCGRADEKLRNKLSEFELIDHISREDLALKNAVPTAEGAVLTALEELPVTLNGLKVLVVGMGRIGTALVNILKGFGADITAAVRSANGEAKARIAGVRSVRTKNMGTGYQLVFNTAPELIFSREILEAFPENTLFIDLASRPGGIDFSAAAELGRKTIWALGLPGKTAPVTAGEIIAETVAAIIKERGEDHD